MTRVEIVSAVKQIIAAVVDQHELLEATDVVAVDSKLHDDLGMDEVDHIDGPDHRTALEQALVPSVGSIGNSKYSNCQ